MVRCGIEKDNSVEFSDFSERPSRIRGAGVITLWQKEIRHAH